MVEIKETYIVARKELLKPKEGKGWDPDGIGSLQVLSLESGVKPTLEDCQKTLKNWPGIFIHLKIDTPTKP